MSDKINIEETSTYLFNCNFYDDAFDPEGHEDHLECAEKLINSNPWENIFEVWSNYLYNNCKTPEEVINFCNLFSYYGGQDYYIPKPYDFIGYIYYIVDIDKYWDEAGDFLDGLCISILERSGELSTTKDPYYQSWKDPKVLKVIETLKLKRANN